MFVETVQNNGIIYLRLVQSVRVTNKNGLKVSAKKVLLNIGPLKKYDDGKPDYVNRLKKSFKDGKPLIPALSKFCPKDNRDLDHYSCSVKFCDNDCIGHPQNYSNTLIEYILEEIGLKSFFSAHGLNNESHNNLYKYVKNLVFNNVLGASLSQRFNNHVNACFGDTINSLDSGQLIETLNNLAPQKEKIIKRINSNLIKSDTQKAHDIFYDVANFYQKDKSNYENDIRNNTSWKNGISQSSVNSKRKNKPIVQVGLFMDDNGIPIAVESFPEDTMEHIILGSKISKKINGMDYSRFIKVCGQDITRKSTILNLLDAGNGYIVHKSLINSSFNEQKWAYDNNGFIFVNQDFKYKSKTVLRDCTDENGDIRQIKERVIVFWDRSDEDSGVSEYKKFIEFLEILDTYPTYLQNTALQTKFLKMFTNNTFNKQETEIASNASGNIWDSFDFSRISDYRNSLGYQQIVTSELSMGPVAVIEKYKGITQIEDQFQVMCRNLKTKPIYEQTTDCINSHLLICLISLVVIRIIQRQIANMRPDANNGFYQSIGMSPERIKEALKKWKIEELPGNKYRFLDIDDPDLSTILKAFGIFIPKRLFSKKELREVGVTCELVK